MKRHNRARVSIIKLSTWGMLLLGLMGVPGILGWTAQNASIDLDLDRSDRTFIGWREGDRLGTVLATGDLDADGNTDFVVAAPHADNPLTGRDRCGVVFVVFGPVQESTEAYDFSTIEDRPATEITWIIGIDEEDWLGCALAVGDLTGDGTDDLAIGIPLSFGPGNRKTWMGEVLIYQGGKALRDTRQLDPNTADHVIYGDRDFDRIGFGLAIGDLTGDGIGDLAVLAPFGDSSRSEWNNRLYLLFGGDTFAATAPQEIPLSQSLLLENIDFDHTSSGNNNNLAIADVNGDSIGDLLIGSPGARRDAIKDNAGIVYVLSGSASLPGITEALDFSDRTTYDVLFQHGRREDRMGQALAVSQVQPDGNPWFAFGAPWGDYDKRDICGLVYLFKGGAWVNSATDILVEDSSAITIIGEDDGHAIGAALAFGDVDGDGWSDLLIGCPFSEGPPRDDDARVGRVYVLYGPTLQAATDIIDLKKDYDLVIYGDRKKEEFGYVVATAEIFAETAADTAEDLLIASWLGDGPPENEGNARGEVYLFKDRYTGPKSTLADFSGDGMIDYQDAFLLGRPQNNGLPSKTSLQSEIQPALWNFVREWKKR